jgi:hypothetical protein
MTKPPERTYAMDGYKPAAPAPQVVTKGYLSPGKVQGGHVAPTQSAPANPPSGGSSVKPPAAPTK